jgi:hypothetical protein
MPSPVRLYKSNRSTTACLLPELMLPGGPNLHSLSCDRLTPPIPLPSLLFFRVHSATLVIPLFPLLVTLHSLCPSPHLTPLVFSSSLASPPLLLHSNPKQQRPLAGRTDRSGIQRSPPLSGCTDQGAAHRWTRRARHAHKSAVRSAPPARNRTSRIPST